MPIDDVEFKKNWDQYIRILTLEACERYERKIHRAMTQGRMYQVFDELAQEVLHAAVKSMTFWQRIRVLFGKRPYILP